MSNLSKKACTLEAIYRLGAVSIVDSADENYSEQSDQNNAEPKDCLL
jgi:hypothetical protein